MKSLSDLLTHELKDIKSAADTLTKFLKRMANSATNAELSNILDTYYNQAQYQSKKLREYFEENTLTEKEEASEIMIKIKDHGRSSMRYQGSSEIRDIALILTLNMVKHFEISVFAAALTHANRLKQPELVDRLLSLKKMIAEDAERPLEIVQSLLEKANQSKIKQEISRLLGVILKAHVLDEQKLLNFLPELIEKAQSSDLIEALETYQDEHAVYVEDLRSFQREFSEEDPLVEWEVMEGYIAEWKQHLKAPQSPLTDIGIILSVQRIQHHNIAILEIEEVLAEYIENRGMQSHIHIILNREIGNDRSLLAIAEGSLFEKGLDEQL
ncbi:MAG: DUF892 family protein [Waddliaceae bacterium]